MSKDKKNRRESREIDIKYGNTGHVGKEYEGKKVRTSKNAMKSTGISQNADPDKWYRALNPGLNTDVFSFLLDFIPTAKRMLNEKNTRSGYDKATDLEEKMWKAYTHGDISGLPVSKYRFDDDDENAQYIGLPQKQSLLIQSLLDKEYMDGMLDKAYEEADDEEKKHISIYREVFDNLNKNIFDNPGKWVLVNEGISPFKEIVYGDKSEELYKASGLGSLKNFSVRWDPDSGMLDVKDDYDFSGKKIVEGIIPQRDIPLRIRERIKYNPKKGSVIRKNPGILGSGFEKRFDEGGIVTGRDGRDYAQEWTSEDLFNPVYSKTSYNAQDQKERDDKFRKELADQHVKGFTDYVVPAIKTAMDFTPVVGEIKSAYDAAQAYVNGHPGEATLAALGAIPVIGAMSRGSGIIGKAGSKTIKKYTKDMPAIANAVSETLYAPRKVVNTLKWAKGDISENGLRRMSKMFPFLVNAVDMADKRSANSVREGIEWLEKYYKHPEAQRKIRELQKSGDATYSPEKIEALRKRGLLKEDGTPDVQKWMESIPVEIGSPSALMDSQIRGFHTPIESPGGSRNVIFNRMGTYYLDPEQLKYVAAHEDNHAMQELFGLENLEKSAGGYLGANENTAIGKLFNEVRNKNADEWFNSPSELHSKLIEYKMKKGLDAGHELSFRDLSDLANDNTFSEFIDFDKADWIDIRRLLNALPTALPVAGAGAVGAYSTLGGNGNNEQTFAEGGETSDWRPSDEILEFILKTERFEPKTYTDGNGHKTIGYGFKDPKLVAKYKRKSMPQKEALRIFYNEKVPEFAKYVANSTENFDKLNDDQKDALFSFVYNVGIGNYKKDYPKLHKALKEEDWASAAFNMDAGYNDKNNKGLRGRRNYERLLFGYYSDDDGNVYPLGEYDTGIKMIQDSALKNKNILELMDPMTSTYREAYDAAKLRGDKKFRYGKKQYPVKYEDGGTTGDAGKISLDNYDIAYDYLVNERGVSPKSAIAIMANLENESGMNAGALNSIGAFGIQQWLGSRKKALLGKYGDSPSLRQQLEFLMDEYDGSAGYSGWNFKNRGKNLGTDRFNYYMYSKADFDNAPTIEDAVVAWNQGFGRPATWELNNDKRIASAKNLAKRYGVEYNPGSYNYTSGTDANKKKENAESFKSYVAPFIASMPVVQTPSWSSTYTPKKQPMVLRKKEDDVDVKPVKNTEHKSSYAKKIQEKADEIKRKALEDKAKMDFFNLVWNSISFDKLKK